jgi:hypothetical protein
MTNKKTRQIEMDILKKTLPMNHMHAKPIIGNGAEVRIDRDN